MSSLEPTSLEMVAHYRKNAAEYSEAADDLSIPRFSSDFMSDFHAWLGGSDNVKLLEAVARLGNYGDAADHADIRKGVSKLLKKRGVSLRRGKRTRPELEELVENLTPLLLYMGLPLASSDRSRLVVVLRALADTFNVPGDPRDKLRTWIKTERRLKKQSRETIQKMIREAFKNLDPNHIGYQQRKLLTSPANISLP